MSTLLQRKKPARRLFPGLVGLPPEAEPAPVKKRGRPPKGDKAMTPAERQRASREGAEKLRSQKEVNRLIARLQKEQAVDHRTGGAYGPGMYMRDADQGKGLLVTGGYDSVKADVVIGAHDRDEKYGGRRKRSPGQGSGTDDFDLTGDTNFDSTGRGELKTEVTGQDAEANEQESSRPATLEDLHEDDGPEREGESVYIGKRISAAFSAEWNARAEDCESEAVLDSMMLDIHVCLCCKKWFDPLTTEGDAYKHARENHPGESPRDIVRTRKRCIVCNRMRASHIEECELTKQDKTHNADCETDLFKMAGIQKRKMTPWHVAHRKAIQRARREVRGIS